ncbi:hypothetical protein DKX38_015276 [Salix brachista]|uniref:protein-disulfide reductase n=1 Tax=Salix brachista TaxID=2182728 RepID=A0A5N5L4R8_9ROSI|nr:hypothetical protein DKX38_015276 [Salix brachista]
MCREFTPKLVELYKRLKEKGENFEVVLISLDHEETHFKESFETMPWLALPFKDKSCEKLARYFELETIPTLVVIGQDGKTLNPNVAELIEDHGIEAYPFTQGKLDELAAIEKAKLESQTLESVLVDGENDFVIDKSGSKVPVSGLVGKNILLYFSAQWCPPCRAFLPKLIEAYHTIKAKGSAFEVIFISSDRDQSTFDEFYSEMPWLTLPFGDGRKQILNKKLKIQGIPAAVAIGPSGRTITKEARMHLTAYGADAFSFTEEHLKQLEEEIEKKAKGWPEKVKHELHSEHELIRTKRSSYNCDGCGESGYSWSFYCKECDFDLHPKCALMEDEDTGIEKGKEGFICDGDVVKIANRSEANRSEEDCRIKTSNRQTPHYVPNYFRTHNFLIIPLYSAVLMTSSNTTQIPSSSTQHFQSLSQPVNNKLEGQNYLTWSVQFQVFLRSHDLSGMIDGSEEAPSKLLSDNSPNPAYTNQNFAFAAKHTTYPKRKPTGSVPRSNQFVVSAQPRGPSKNQFNTDRGEQDRQAAAPRAG